MIIKEMGPVRVSPLASLSLSAACLLLSLGACAPLAGLGQVATHAIAPPGKNVAVLQHENAACTRAANGVVRIFVQCMEQRGNRVELFGPGGMPMSIAQLPLPSQEPPKVGAQLQVAQQSVNTSGIAANEADPWIAARAAEQAGDYALVAQDRGRKLYGHR